MVWGLALSRHSETVPGSVPPGFFPGAPVSSHNPKTCMLDYWMTLDVCLAANLKQIHND